MSYLVATSLIIYEAFQRSNVGQVLRPAGGSFILEKLFAPDDRHGGSVDLVFNSVWPGLIKFDTRYGCQNINPIRRDANLIDVFGSTQIVDREFTSGCAELPSAAHTRSAFSLVGRIQMSKSPVARGVVYVPIA
jgi:hypothetical protein